MSLRLFSDVPGIVWPAIPGMANAPVLALLQQFEHTQWWPRERLLARQLDQVRSLVDHARRTSRFWRQRIEAAGLANADAFDWSDFARLQLLTRDDLQMHYESLRSDAPPFDHGKVGEGRTSGSTATPIRVLSTQLQGLFWHAFTIREALWQRRDFEGKLAALRVHVPRASHPDWGPPYSGLIATGPGATNDITLDIGALYDWLIEEAPACFFSFPTVMRDLVRVSLERGVMPGGLRHATTYGEALPDDLREVLNRHWGVKLSDMYSASECGYVALQCPQSDNYHVQSENVFVEVLDDAGSPCAPGVVGRVVITVLHAFALPLIRYDIGDYAEAGSPCECGRGLPVLRRIMGRQRSMIRLPDGRRVWPMFNMFEWHTRFGVRQARVVQTSLQHMRAEVIVDAARRLDASGLVEFMRERIDYPVDVDVVPVAGLARSTASGKFEDVISEVV